MSDVECLHKGRDRLGVCDQPERVGSGHTFLPTTAVKVRKNVRT